MTRERRWELADALRAEARKLLLRKPFRYAFHHIIQQLRRIAYRLESQKSDHSAICTAHYTEYMLRRDPDLKAAEELVWCVIKELRKKPNDT